MSETQLTSAPPDEPGTTFVLSDTHLERPLRIEFGGGYQESSNWKHRLSRHYGGKTGRALSSALRNDGFDSIVTHDKYGNSEIVVL